MKNSYQVRPKVKSPNNDLNDDGLEEVFLYLSGHRVCGHGGCHLVIFQFYKENNKLEYQTARSSSDDILILNRRTNGYHKHCDQVNGWHQHV
jgi:hypothetical protein